MATQHQNMIHGPGDGQTDRTSLLTPEKDISNYNATTKSSSSHRSDEANGEDDHFDSTSALLEDKGNSQYDGNQRQSCDERCNTMMILIRFLLTVSLLLLLLAVPISMMEPREWWLRKDHKTRKSAPQNSTPSSSTSHSFDYIVVGAGPSGILAACRLAQALPHLKILLLESGTLSQAMVMDALRKQEPPLTRPSKNSTSKTSASSSSYMPSQPLISLEALNAGPTPLNMFDIPLLWSGLASSQGRKRAMTLQREQLQYSSDPKSPSFRWWSDHHWPIEKTLLGRGVGGGGIHNAMTYVRSLPEDFEAWNMTGWEFSDILPHYQELENYDQELTKEEESEISDFSSDEASSPDNQRDDEYDSDNDDLYDDVETLTSWRGENGLIETQRAGPAIDAVAPLFVQAAINAGHRWARRGFNTPDPELRVGAGYYEFNIRDGRRDSVAQALLSRGRQPVNLMIQTDVSVTRVLFVNSTHENGPRATGVEFIWNESGEKGTLHLHDSHGEVILATGAIMTPQLLANSGVEANGAIVHLPGVGQNLHDHPVVSLSVELSPELAEQASSVYTIGDELEDYVLSVHELELMSDNTTTADDRMQFRKLLGALGTPGFSAGAFLRSPWAPDHRPDIQLTVFPRQIEPHVVRQEEVGEVSYLRSRVMLVTVALLQPEARYQVKPNKLAVSVEEDDQDQIDGSESIRDRLLKLIKLPTIELPDDRRDYLTERDTDRLVWGMEQARQILASPPISQQTGQELHPGSKIQGDLLREHVKHQNLPNSHWVGSTKMGPSDDPLAVVDERLRVRGVDGLRVVDAGVIPWAPNGNTHSTVCAVASRAVQWIVLDRQRTKE